MVEGSGRCEAERISPAAPVSKLGIEGTKLACRVVTGNGYFYLDGQTMDAVIRDTAPEEVVVYRTTNDYYASTNGVLIPAATLRQQESTALQTSLPVTLERVNVTRDGMIRALYNTGEPAAPIAHGRTVYEYRDVLPPEGRKAV